MNTVLPPTEPPGTPGELLAMLQGAGGGVRIPNPRPPARARWRRAIHALVNGGELVAGYCVRHTGRDKGDLMIRVVPVEEAAPAPAKPAPVAIPDSLHGCHRMISATRAAAKAAGNGWTTTYHAAGVVHLRVQRSSLRRVLLIMQALVNEAGRRRHEVSQYNGASECEGGFAVVIRKHSFEISVRETTRRVEHVPTAAEVKAEERTPYARIEQWDYVPAGTLELHVGHASYGSPLAADRHRWKVEDRLARVLDTLESSAAERDAAAAEQERRRQEARRAEEVAAEQKRQHAIKRRQLQWLSRQLRDFRRARDAREFVAAARAVTTSAADLDWLDWVETHANDIDPLKQGLAPPPASPEPPPSEVATTVDVRSMRWTPGGIARRFGLPAATVRWLCKWGQLRSSRVNGVVSVTYQDLHEAIEAGVLDRPAGWLTPEEAQIQIDEEWHR